VKLGFSPRAIVDLTDIGDFIHADNPQAARSFVKLVAGSALKMTFSSPHEFSERTRRLCRLARGRIQKTIH
jgi:plasmid stabilization system protein ParE